MSKLVVTRSAARTWLLTLAGVPFVLLGSELVFGGRLLALLGSLIYGSDPPAPEWRDAVWGWAFLVVGGVVVAWGLKELIFPSPVLVADERRLCLAVRGPLRPPACLEWEQVVEVREVVVGEGPERSSAVSVLTNDPSLLPDHPWGARWDDGRLVLLAGLWSLPASQVVAQIRGLGAVDGVGTVGR